MKDHLLAFEVYMKKPITFEPIDLNFYEQLVHFLTYEYEHKKKQAAHKGLKQNTLGKTVKELSISLKNRAKSKIIPAIDLEGFKILEEETYSIYLA
jgi:hypothetical protein